MIGSGGVADTLWALGVKYGGQCHCRMIGDIHITMATPRREERKEERKKEGKKERRERKNERKKERKTGRKERKTERR